MLPTSTRHSFAPPGQCAGDAIDLEAIGRRLGFLQDHNDNVIELASPLRSADG
jgi:hypothetical protein